MITEFKNIRDWVIGLTLVGLTLKWYHEHRETEALIAFFLAGCNVVANWYRIRKLNAEVKRLKEAEDELKRKAALPWAPNIFTVVPSHLHYMDLEEVDRLILGEEDEPRDGK